MHSGQTPDRRMAEASSKKRIVTSIACEILANAQECASDCARMHRLELDEPNVRPWLKLCSVMSVRRSAELSVRTEGWCPENHVPTSVRIPVWYEGAPQAQKKLGELKI